LPSPRAEDDGDGENGGCEEDKGGEAGAGVVAALAGCSC